MALSVLILGFAIASASPSPRQLRGQLATTVTTTSKTPSSTTECTDSDSGTFDVDGYGCAAYAAYPSYCVKNGNYDDEDFTLVDMCCACGDHSINVTYANCTDTDHGSTDTEGYRCADYAAFPSYCVQDGSYDNEDFTLVDMCCVCGTIDGDDVYGTCVDTHHGSTDADGYSCEDYSVYPSQCVQTGAYDDEDFTLVDMCCACGVDVPPSTSYANCTDTDHGSTDAEGYGCVDYAAFPSYCVQDGSYDDEDFTLVDMCCACGAGGSGAAGGVYAQCTDTDGGASDVEGYSCAAYAEFPSYCVQDGAYDDSDFTLVDMCCACGGGE